MDLHSPYTKNKNRLVDVIAAIQVMGSYKCYKLEFSDWADRISGYGSRGDYWCKIFVEHPEFFRLDSGRNKASLVWRRTYQKLYHVDLGKQITRAEFDELSPEQMQRISRNPLSNADISTLINTAISLHAEELDHKADSRWWIVGVLGLVGVLLGAVLQWLVC
jgi:hypothetical protein